MPFPFFIVDAFTSQYFAGNQAAVCLIPNKLSDSAYIKLAAEFKYSETAFPLPVNGDFKTASHFRLRWFTPTMEAPNCGHATLATSHALFDHAGNVNDELRFTTMAGELRVKRAKDDHFRMDFPRYRVSTLVFDTDSVSSSRTERHFTKLRAPEYVFDMIRMVVPDDIEIESVAYAWEPKAVYVVVDSTMSRSDFETRFNIVTRELLETHPNGEFVNGIIVTINPQDPEAQGFVDDHGESFDYALRYFAAWLGIDEDPATGSAQCGLSPFWGRLLGKDSLYALQAFPGRGAELRITLEPPDRIAILGKAVTVVSGLLHHADS